MLQILLSLPAQSFGVLHYKIKVLDYTVTENPFSLISESLLHSTVALSALLVIIFVPLFIIQQESVPLSFRKFAAEV